MINTDIITLFALCTRFRPKQLSVAKKIHSRHITLSEAMHQSLLIPCGIASDNEQWYLNADSRSQSMELWIMQSGSSHGKKLARSWNYRIWLLLFTITTNENKLHSSHISTDNMFPIALTLLHTHTRFQQLSNISALLYTHTRFQQLSNISGFAFSHIPTNWNLDKRFPLSFYAFNFTTIQTCPSS